MPLLSYSNFSDAIVFTNLCYQLGEHNVDITIRNDGQIYEMKNTQVLINQNYPSHFVDYIRKIVFTHGVGVGHHPPPPVGCVHPAAAGLSHLTMRKADSKSNKDREKL